MNKLLLRFVVRVFFPCLILITSTAFFSEIQAQNVTGKVFRDFDANGQQSSTNPIEPSVQGVTVKVYKADGTLLDTKTTASDGTYTLIVGTSSQVRVEFSNLPSAYFGGPKGSGSGTTVQFVNGGGTANLGVNYPSDYCGIANPQLVTPCYINGTPLNGGSSANDPAIVAIPYTPTGNGTVGTTSENVYLAKSVEVGATWGMAYQRSSKFIFTSALLKRHSGFGTGGPGAIYKINNAGATPVTTLFVDLNADLGITAGTDPRNPVSAADSLPKFKTQPSRDSTAFGLVGKMALGDLDISDDEKTLWVINTFDKKLYELPIGSPAVKPTTKVAHTLPNPGCTNGVFRPWAVKFWRGKVYIGGVCTAENAGGTAADLKAYIYSFTPGDANPNNFTEVYNFKLDYPRGFTSLDGTKATSAAWKPWIAKWSDITNPLPDAAAYNQTICPQPMLSDIEFDVDGSMILGFMDRSGHQLGSNNYSTLKTDLNTATGQRNLYEGTSAGDLLRVGLNSDGVTYTLEKDATVNGVVSGGKGQSPSQGPGTGEFYWQDMYGKNADKNLPSNASGGGHQEISLGGLALFPGKNEVVETVFDPLSAFRAGGVRWFDNTTGAAPRAYEIFGQDAGGLGVTFGKANGLGDLELLCAVQPIEVGNRIWNDLDKDGIQDAGEPVLANVEVELWKNGVKVTGTTTSATGEYYFTGLNPNTDYEIRIPNVKGGTKQTNLLGLEPTQANTNSNGFDNIDSDASISGTNTYAVIPFTTGNGGENNHTLDAGFTCIKPIANPTTTAVKVCEPATTVNLVDATTGTEPQTWSVLATGNPSTSQITSSTGVVTGMTAIGVYKYVLTSTLTGCKDTVSVTRNEQPNAGADQKICTPTQTAQLVAASTGEIWSAQAGNPSNATVINAGNVAGMTSTGGYFFILTDANACKDTVEVLRIEKPDAGVDITVCSPTQTATLTAANATLGQSWAASNSNPALATINNGGNVAGMTVDGIYTFGLTQNGCTDSVKVTRQTGGVVIATGSTVCQGQIWNLTANSSASAYVWTGPSGFTSTQKNPSIINATINNAGTYTVVANFAAGCTASATATVVVNLAPIATATNNSPFCAGSELKLTATGGGTYAWAGPSGFVATTSNPSILNATASFSGIYSVLVTNAAGCTATATTVVVINPNPSVDAISNSPICTGANINLTAAGGSSYSWTGPANFTSTVSNITFTANPDLSQAGIYTVKVTNQFGCTAMATTSVVIQKCLKLGDLVWNDVNNDGKKDAAEVGIPTVTVNLYKDVNADGIPDGAAIATTTTDANGKYLFSNLDPDKYIVEVVAPAGYKSSTGKNGAATGPNEGAATPGDNDVNDDDNGTGSPIRTKTITLTNFGESIIDGDTDNNSNLTVDFGLFIPASLGSTVWNDTNKDGIKDPTENGIDNVTVKLLDGAGNVVATTTTNPSGIYSFDNLIPGTYVVEFVKSTLPAGFEFSPKDQGGIDTKDSDVDPTTGKTDPITLTAGQQKTDVFAGASLDCVKPVLQVTATSPRCEGANVQLSVSGGGTYQWTGPAGFSSTVSNPSFPLVSVSNSGTYTVTATSSGTCVATAQATIALIINAVPTVTVVGSTVCSGGNIQLTATSTGSILYEWAGPSAFTSTLSNPQIANATVSNAGIYTVKVTNPNGCTANATAQVSVGASLSVTATSNSPVCVGKDLTLSANGGAGATYAWTGPNNFVSTAAAVTIAQAQVIATGVYSVKVTNTDGCTGTATTAVIVSPVPTTAPVSAEVCQGGNVTITFTGGVGYSWTGPNNFTATTAEVTLTNVQPVNAGAYTVVVSNVNQCTSTALANVIVNPSPTVSATGATVCTGGTLQLSASSVAGATYAWVGPNNFTSTSKTPTISNATVSNAGTYGVLVTDLKGCKATANATVTVGAKINGGNDVTICDPITTAKITVVPGATWTAEATNPKPLTINQTTGEVSGMTVNGIYVLYLTNGDCKDTINIFRNQKLDAGDDQVLCSPKSTIKLLATTTGQSWSSPTVPAGATVVIDVQGNATGMSVDGIYQFVLTQNGNPSCTDTVMVTRAAAPNAGTDQTGNSGICEAIQIAKLQAATATQTWIVATGNPAVATIDQNGNVAKMTVNGVYVFILKQGDCADSVKIERKVKPVAGDDIKICEPLTIAKVKAATTGQTWSPAAGNPANATVTANGDITGLTANGTYQFVFTANGCTDTLNVVRFGIPNAGPDLVGNKAICEPSEVAKLPTPVAGSTWSVATGNPTNATINVTGEIAKMTVNGIYTFILKNDNGCVDSVKVERSVSPKAGADTTICGDVSVVKLKDAPQNQAWSAVSGNPTSATINPVTGEVIGMTTNGVYKFVLSSLAGCTDTLKVERLPLPIFDAATEQASCTGSTPVDDAKLVLTNFGTGNKYDYSEGLTYSGTKTYATATTIPATGIIVNNLPNPSAAKTYTVRVFNANGCYLDKTVTLNPRICECKPDVCVPFVAMKTKSGRP